MSNDDSIYSSSSTPVFGELRKEGLSGCDALRKVHTEPPETFAAFQRGLPQQTMALSSNWSRRKSARVLRRGRAPTRHQTLRLTAGRCSHREIRRRGMRVHGGGRPHDDRKATYPYGRNEGSAPQQPGCLRNDSRRSSEMYSPAERRAHVAGIVDRPTRPEPTKLDYIAALMRAN